MPKKRSKNYEDNLRKIRRMNLFSDFFMTICFDKNKELAEMVLKIILKKPRLKILTADTQVTLKNIRERSVRFDVLAEDGSGRKMNIEVQRRREGADPWSIARTIIKRISSYSIIEFFDENRLM